MKPSYFIPLLFDLGQIQKVFYSLLTNAFKFTPESGWVSIEITQNTKNEIVITVTNSGSGIAERDMDRLFDIFFRAPSHTGHGNGLALSKGIIDLDYGKLTVTSRHYPGGEYGHTTFTLALLAGSRHYSSDQLSKSETVLTTYSNFGVTRVNGQEAIAVTEKKYTILLIEDNDELREFEKGLFSETYHVLDAANGADGLKLAFEHVPDLILCDVMMSEQNGILVCGQLKADIRTFHIPIILLTARRALPQLMEGLKAGADDYLVKPFDSNVLFLKINNLIKVRQQLRGSYKKSLSSSSDEMEADDAHGEFIGMLRGIVLENISHSDFGVNKMAFQVGMSISVLYRKLRSLTGMTVNDFIKSIKMQKALRLLESSSYQVGEVALMVGYEDVRYFSKEFKKIYGKNPSQSRIAHD